MTNLAIPTACGDGAPDGPGDRRARRGAVARLALGLAIVAALALMPAGLRSESDPPAVRQIAPERFPTYLPDREPPPEPDGGARRGPGLEPFELRPPTAEQPLGACGPHMSKVTYNRCLAQTLEWTRRTLDETVAQAKAAVEQREQLTYPTRMRWSRVLGEVHEAWKQAREMECSQLVILEKGNRLGIFEERAKCLIALNRVRIDDLKQRYGLP